MKPTRIFLASVLVSLVSSASFATATPCPSNAMCAPIAVTTCQLPQLLPGCTVTNCVITCTNGNPGHPTTNQVIQTSSIGQMGNASDGGGWLYSNDPASQQFGQVMVNCNHDDMKGSIWYTE
jgi:hypothetical protein